MHFSVRSTSPSRTPNPRRPMALPPQLLPKIGWTSLTSLERWLSRRILRAPTVPTQTYRTLRQALRVISTWTLHPNQKAAKDATLSKNIKQTTTMIHSRAVVRDLANGNRKVAWLLYSKGPAVASSSLLVVATGDAAQGPRPAATASA